MGGSADGSFMVMLETDGWSLGDQNWRVLVVEDDKDIRELIQLCLESDGLEVITAADGREALARVEEVRPDAILLDLVMPEVDGWEVIRTLKSRDDDIADVPVFMMTAYGDRQSRVRGALERACRYITKPFDPNVLPGMIRAEIASSRELDNA